MTSTVSKKKTYPCKICNSTASKGYRLQCSVCETWIHQKCANVSDDLLEYITDTSNGLTWACPHCKDGAAKLNLKVLALHEKMEALEKEVNDNRAKLDEMRNDLQEMKKKANENKDAVATSQDRIQDSIFAEMRAREEKKNNILFHGIPESANTEGFQRKKDDMENILKITRKLKIAVCKDDIKFVRRLGEKNTQKARPLLIGLKENGKKTLFLENARNLNKFTEYESVRIVPDLTLKQRKEEDAMRMEAEKLNRELDEETAKESEWRLVGQKGEKRLVLGKKLHKQTLDEGRQQPKNDYRKSSENRKGDRRKSSVSQDPMPNTHDVDPGDVPDDTSGDERDMQVGAKEIDVLNRINERPEMNREGRARN